MPNMRASYSCAVGMISYIDSFCSIGPNPTLVTRGQSSGVTMQVLRVCGVQKGPFLTHTKPTVFSCLLSHRSASHNPFHNQSTTSCTPRRVLIRYLHVGRLRACLNPGTDARLADGRPQGGGVRALLPVVAESFSAPDNVKVQAPDWCNRRGKSTLMALKQGAGSSRCPDAAARRGGLGSCLYLTAQ
jgi:hypothetical protein